MHEFTKIPFEADSIWELYTILTEDGEGEERGTFWRTNNILEDVCCIFYGKANDFLEQ